MDAPTRSPRLPPLSDPEIDADLLERMAPWRVGGRLYNVFRTYARHPALAQAWGPWGAYAFARSTLAARQRELLILRTTWICESPYEFAHHARVGLDAGLSEEVIIRLAREGGASPAWSPLERALLAAADELECDACLSDGTWSELVAELGDHGVLDVVFTCGTYRIGSTVLNSAGTPLEDTLPSMAAPLEALVDELVESRGLAPQG